MSFRPSDKSIEQIHDKLLELVLINRAVQTQLDIGLLTPIIKLRNWWKIFYSNTNRRSLTHKL